MSERPFVDHYEVLQLGQNADAETVERVYRILAKRYHPDNQATGNLDRFAELQASYAVLSNSDTRAAYDVKYDETRALQWHVFDQRSAGNAREEDRRIFHGLLSLLYVARRRDTVHGGLGPIFLEKTLGVPRHHLEFPLWYLKQHGWIEILDNGQFAITVQGIDRLADQALSLPDDRLLVAASEAGAPADDELGPEQGQITDAQS